MKRISLALTLMLFAAFQLASAKSKVSIDRVEPAFWWAGMEHPELQLLIHGKDISNLTPTLSYDGVQLDQTIKVDNPNYLFLVLKISEGVKPGSFPIEFKQKGKVVFTYNYEFKQRRDNSAGRQGFSNKDVMYLITPDRFANGIPENDTVDGLKEAADRSNMSGRHGGDIQGIINNLDYIQDLGFTALWVNPLLENDMETYSYHGYSTTDYYKIDKRFGSNEDYVRLSAEAKKRGIKLIMDQIENHCGLNHWWTNDLPTADWYNFQDLEKKPYSTHQRVSLADPYGSETDRKGHADGWFVDTMPDLNQKNELLANYLIQNSIWWVEFGDLGGIRQDTYSYPDANFMAEWSRRIMLEYPNFNIVGEEWSENPAIVSRWQKGKVNANGYESYLPSLMDFPVQAALKRSLNKEIAPYSNTFNEVYETLAEDFLYADPYNLVIFPDNHDTPRFFNQVNENYDLFKMGLMYIYTTRGIPQIFYGTEILMGNVDHPEDHAYIREDMPGGWEGDKANVFKGEGLSKEQKDALNFVKTLTTFRRDTPALHDGKLKQYAPANEIFVMFRYDESTKVMTIFNKNVEDKDVELAHYEESIQGAKSAKNVLTGETYDLSKGTLKVPGMTSLMLVIE
ncbi:glycoside hydrolase family 13 protein [Flammeovirga kamogawensis]|uniref:Glycoside hydrolase family 13 protein n=1 Tax=Flammeovirga kamogawensis TaxID=373891 RepID=A0ABX8GV15_9BACT|nr:glycoside hydrolase family 13 protein [Flammeovirga kamogawensis]MBB6459802.1 glycosidase [Flammeovirga kamogawensis]QWG07142.1 glycoside hydrolase family 13 protein [Flammeovirga kamogawensis]TRX68964.1 alpha-amlyase [Flammeovirga kamogawensis]